MKPFLTRAVCRAYAISLYAYPPEFRARYGQEMRQCFRQRCRDTDYDPSFFCATVRDWLITSTQERFATMTNAFFTARKWRIARALALVALAALLYLGVTATVVQAYVIAAPSMEASLRVGDHLLVNKLGGGLQRGDMVVFRYPEDPRQTFIKRVIGLPGDRIRLENKQVVRNGRRLVEPYAIHLSASIVPYRDNFPMPPSVATSPGGAEMFARAVAGGEVTVPAGALFVLGDNRDNSLDSRYWGFVPAANVVGRPWIVYWSYDARSGKTRWDRTLMVPAAPPAREVE